MDPNLSNAHGQLAALTAAMRALIEANPAAKVLVKIRLEQASADMLNTNADQAFLDGIAHITAALTENL